MSSSSRNIRPSLSRRHGHPHGSTHRHAVPWLVAFLAPTLAALVILRIIPLVDAILSSLYKAFPGGIRPATFAAFFNYSALTTNPVFLHSIVLTILFNVIINPLQVGIALLLAVLFTRRMAARSIWRTFVIVPVMVPVVGSCVLWGAALGPQGPVNGVLKALAGSPQPFFTSPNQALASIIIVASWIGIGYWMLFLIDGIEAVPGELYEAAQLDGGGGIRQFFSITIPLVRRQILFVLVADTVANFVLFVPIQMLTNGGPQNSTNLLMWNIYQTTYTYGSGNAGAAQVVVLTVIMLIFVLIQFRMLRDDAVNDM